MAKISDYIERDTESIPRILTANDSGTFNNYGILTGKILTCNLASIDQFKDL